MERAKMFLWLFGMMLLLGMVTSVRFKRGQVEQDHYIEYAHMINQGTMVRLSPYDLRLFPGLSWLISLGGRFSVSGYSSGGYLLTWLSVIGSGLILWLFTHSARSLLGLFFPPVVVAAASTIGTEMPIVFLLTASLYAFHKKKWWMAAMLVGIGVWFRLIMGVVGVFMIVRLLYIRHYKAILLYGYTLCVAVSALVLWNLFVFGDVAVQVRGNIAYGRPEVGIWQLMLDIPRAISWGWWRQVGSGMAYLALLGMGLFIGLREVGYERREKTLMLTIKWLVVGMVGFVFMLGPTPFLEEFPRFLVPVWPLLWLLIYKEVKGRWVWLLPFVSVLVVLI